MNTRRHFLKRGSLWVTGSLAFPAILRAQVMPSARRQVAMLPAASAPSSCPSSPGISCTTGTSSSTVCSSSSSIWVGQSAFTNASPLSVCRLDFCLSLASGSLVGKKFFAEIWTMSGTALSTQVGKSDLPGVDGSDAWSSTWVEFDFATPCSLAAATNYALTVTMNEAADGTNYAAFKFLSSGGVIAGTGVRWKSDKTLNNDLDPGDMNLKIYYT